MTVRVGLERYTVMAKHGYYEFEHDKDQPVSYTHLTLPTILLV